MQMITALVKTQHIRAICSFWLLQLQILGQWSADPLTRPSQAAL